MKKLKYLFIFLLFIFVLVGCKADRGDDYLNESPGGNEEEVKDDLDATPNRKIIFTINTSLRTDNLEQSISLIRNSLNNDEWFDEEYISINSATFVIRVKSSRIDEFIDSLKTTGTISSYSKKANDVSLKYEDHTYEIASLEAELTRLNDLYKNASMNEMIELNKRITVVTSEINRLKKILREFDSLVDYSVIHLSINQKAVKEKTGFLAKLSNAFNSGWNAVLVLLEGIVIVITAILPFSIIIIPVGGAILLGNKIRNRKKAKK